ncbi:MAG: hypothetical protein ABGY11_08620 [Candidatus Thioglobus sp.]|jgi:hypothetical protein|nr:hypothetical protein [Candidatus Lambdaproteobacteria bacterium]
MNKEIKDRLDKLENELKESKNEIHNLKSSVSLTIERGIGKLLSRFTRKQLILGSVIALFLISIIGIAGTVTKTYTFSSGEVVSASKFNTNFDTLFTLVNGNLDDSNISGISGSKITSGTVAAARLDNLSASMITSGTIDGARIDNVSSTAINYEGIFIFNTYTGNTGYFETSPGTSSSRGDLGGRSGADAICNNWKYKVSKHLSTCNNVRAMISIDSNDEISDMPTNYSVPSDKPVFNESGHVIADNLTHLVSGNNLYTRLTTDPEGGSYWIGSSTGGALHSNNCSGFSSTGGTGQTHENQNYFFKAANYFSCNSFAYLLCMCY